jgi:hypothetical protein
MRETTETTFKEKMRVLEDLCLTRKRLCDEKAKELKRVRGKREERGEYIRLSNEFDNRAKVFNALRKSGR